MALAALAPDDVLGPAACGSRLVLGETGGFVHRGQLRLGVGVTPSGGTVWASFGPVDRSIYQTPLMPSKRRMHGPCTRHASEKAESVGECRCAARAVAKGFMEKGVRAHQRRATRTARRPRISLGLRLRLCTTWWRGQDLNLRPSGYEPDELPDCSTPRCRVHYIADITSQNGRRHSSSRTPPFIKLVWLLYL